MPRYSGTCHCGAIRFEIDTLIDRVTDCNCSICRKKGFLHHRVPPERFTLVSGAESLGTYQFGTRTAKHHFCTHCGVHVFTRPRAAPQLYTVNVRVLDDFDLLAASGAAIVPFNGQEWEANAARLDTPEA